MTLVLLAFGVFWVLETVSKYVEAPDWFWTLFRVTLSGAMTLSARVQDWYYIPVVAGMALFISRVADVLLIKGDELVTRIRRR